jgi:hypothetical protein
VARSGQEREDYVRSGIRRLSALMVTRGALIALALVGVVLILVTPAHA